MQLAAFFYIARMLGPFCFSLNVYMTVSVIYKWLDVGLKLVKFVVFRNNPHLRVLYVLFMVLYFLIKTIFLKVSCLYILGCFIVGCFIVFHHYKMVTKHSAQIPINLRTLGEFIANNKTWKYLLVFLQFYRI